MTKKYKVSKSSKDSDSETARLLQEKSKFEARRNELIMELLDTERKITSIQSKYGAICNRNIPVLNLPNEVTCMIFDYMLAFCSRSPDPTDPKAKILPLAEIVVSHVCHHWRSVALSYHQLWASFRYDILRSPSVPFERFDAYLERSASVGLELWFWFRGALGESEDLLELLQKAIPHVKRWKRFTLTSDSETPVHEVLEVIKDKLISAPMLEHFAFCSHMGATGPGSFRVIDSLDETVFRNGAPKLKSVLLDLTGAITSFPPLSNVTTLRIEDLDRSIDIRLSWSAFRDIVSLPSLVNLSVTGNACESPNFNTITPILMDNLKHMRISDNLCLILLLPYIRAPLLETLTLRDSLFPENFATCPHGSDTHISNPYVFPSLKYLCFINVCATLTPSARQFAKMTANTVDMTFSSGDYDESFFSAYMAPAENKERETLWPKIEVLTFNIDVDDELDDILRFAQGRPKKSVTLRLFDDMHEAWKVADLVTDVTYVQVARAYKLETINSKKNWLVQVQWPPVSGGYREGLFVDEDDPFSVEGYDDDDFD
ncbi:hypothetical protein CPB84DRAFT_1777547 [Gymnopilus junonius]|uniref:F-box domain-containing protein n=1 Tax=Gymnopilus junonius TaxID=109634 RepID=A0A9P5NNV9_GYMJU|nr:hypothetical protein CPB84DRAFT_1777547 [Gymnopilus junonius]